MAIIRITQGSVSSLGTQLSIEGGIDIQDMESQDASSFPDGSLKVITDLSTKYICVKFTLANAPSSRGYIKLLQNSNKINIDLNYTNSDSGVNESYVSGVVQNALPNLNDTNSVYGEIELRFPKL